MKHRYYFILLFERLFWCSAHIQTSNDIALLCFAASLVNRLASQSWCCCTAKSRPNSSRSCTEVTTTVGWEQTLKSHEEPKVLILRLLQKVHYIATSTHFYPFRFWVAWCRTQWWQCGEYWQAQLEKTPLCPQRSVPEDFRARRPVRAAWHNPVTTNHHRS